MANGFNQSENVYLHLFCLLQAHVTPICIQFSSVASRLRLLMILQANTCNYLVNGLQAKFTGDHAF